MTKLATLRIPTIVYMKCSSRRTPVQKFSPFVAVISTIIYKKLGLCVHSYIHRAAFIACTSNATKYHMYLYTYISCNIATISIHTIYSINIQNYNANFPIHILRFSSVHASQRIGRYLIVRSRLPPPKEKKIQIKERKIKEKISQKS